MAVADMASGKQPNHMGAGGDRAFDSDRRILDDQSVGDVDPQLVGGEQVKVRRRLGPADMLAAAVEMLAEALAQPEIVKVAGDPATEGG